MHSVNSFIVILSVIMNMQVVIVLSVIRLCCFAYQVVILSVIYV